MVFSQNAKTWFFRPGNEIGNTTKLWRGGRKMMGGLDSEAKDYLGTIGFISVQFGLLTCDTSPGHCQNPSLTSRKDHPLHFI